MILDMFKLDGKVAIVTGCRRGIGRALALGLAEAGADIVAVMRSEEPGLEREITSLGRRYLWVEADLSSIEPVERIVEEAVKAFGKVDILVNNAGIIRRDDILDFSEEDWDEVMNVNLKSVFFLSQAVARRMKEQGTGGKIINIASMLSFQGGIRVPSYTASKSGVLGLTRILGNELAKYDIQVNAIAPGYIETDNTRALREDPVRNKEILGRIPAGRWGSPDDLKGAVVFLASPASDYMTGSVVAVDGGWLAR
ncbi:2-dehydro-3-deoxy-D-gluconate 5-dehydrogenase KduD [Spirochaeta thermophila]|uniref:2-dehydro-3-deoxy-D-gluconate 5-dehydrogenase n=1 Tax=Winmispira thermophila (strain ATCC 49972 / DSM 6192 / RI 19.B1) TaxID=665571 RepID=E0RPS2_WINT6|nr:2-dehydro-3-deoxy-D-gluconate 5-dehydrogenase KduD [Spirochaeta thermophila]ADN01386.1 2-deoxy-D-gluconate 3-dehydrogenase [Spirochaeta thermophila DSM 6192]